MAYECEIKTPYIVDGQKVHKWKPISATELDTRENRPIRCAGCHGRVRVHKQQQSDGTPDHVEHLSRQDSKGCPYGIYFDGTQRMSKHPVE